MFVTVKVNLERFYGFTITNFILNGIKSSGRDHNGQVLLHVHSVHTLMEKILLMESILKLVLLLMVEKCIQSWVDQVIT